jgi:hypothetical protein
MHTRRAENAAGGWIFAAAGGKGQNKQSNRGTTK